MRHTHVWLPCRVLDHRPMSLKTSVLDNHMRERVVYVPLSLVKEEQPGRVMVPRWWAVAQRDLPYDAA